MVDHAFVLLVYQDSPFLSACLDSLVHQKEAGQILISTSTPSPYITQIATLYQVPVFVSTSGKGIAGDWNFGLSLAKTKYVTLAHQDDLYLPDYVSKCVATAEAYSDTLICFTNYDEIIKDEIRSSSLLLGVKRFMLQFLMGPKHNLRSIFWKHKLLMIGCPISAPSVMFNRERIPDFQFSTDYSINMDWEAWSRLAGRVGRFVYVKEKLMHHRIHSESATTSGLNSNTRKAEDQRMFQKFWPPWMAKLLVSIYSLSYKSNQLEERP